VEVVAILSTSKASGEGISGHFGTFKQKTGCFFGQKSFSAQLSLVSLDFFQCHFRVCMRLHRNGSRPGGEFEQRTVQGETES
jgi:hypothetical protein